MQAQSDNSPENIKNSAPRVLTAVLGLISGLPMLVIAIGMIVIWISPIAIADGELLAPAAKLIMVEFLLLHSGAFMAVGPMMFERTKFRVLWFFGFVLLYGIFFWAIATEFEAAWFTWMLVSVLLSRLMVLVVLPNRQATMLLLSRSAIGMSILLVTCFGLVFWPWPELGVTSEIRYVTFGSGDDILSESPQSMLVWGIAYFGLMAMAEFAMAWYWPDQSDEEIDGAWRDMKKRSAT